jgi:hypothetical protein
VIDVQLQNLLLLQLIHSKGSSWLVWANYTWWRGSKWCVKLMCFWFFFKHDFKTKKSILL